MYKSSLILTNKMNLALVCTIHIIGDWGRRGQFHQQNIANIMSNIEHDAVISVGDNFYPEGIQNSHDPHIYDSWQNIYNPSKPWFVALGNHDHRGNTTAQTLIDLPFWNMPAPIYAFDKCNQTFVVMDSTHINKQQLRIVEYLLGKTSLNKWIIAHHPIYTSGWHHHVDEEYRQKMINIYDKYNVKGIISGHDHNLQHIELDGIVQIVSGAGSSAYGAQYEQPGLEFFYDNAGFVQMDFKENNYNLKYIGINGTIFEKTQFI